MAEAKRLFINMEMYTRWRAVALYSLRIPNSWRLQQLMAEVLVAFQALSTLGSGSEHFRHVGGRDVGQNMMMCWEGFGDLGKKNRNSFCL